MACVGLSVALGEKCPQCFPQFGQRSVAKQIARNLGADSCCEVALEKCTNLLLYIAKGLVTEIRFPDAFATSECGDEASNGRSDGPR